MSVFKKIIKIELETFHAQNIFFLNYFLFFLALMRKMWEKDIWTTLFTVPCLEQLSGKIN